jgi:5-(carboxyamino)imidazole ribonucleotide synthase
MTLEALSPLGIDGVIGERFPNSPAARISAHEVVFDGCWNDLQALRQVARLSAVVTLENEFVEWQVLEHLEGLGVAVWPSPRCVEVVQDKLLQKRALARVELPVPPFHQVDTPADVVAVADDFGWPLMLKARRDGYDGRGNVLVRKDAEAEAACRRLGWPRRALYVEAFVPFERELAVIVVRDQQGAIAAYPVAETRQDPRLHICQTVLAPAEIASEVRARAARIAVAAVEAVDGVGAFGIEQFLLPNGEVCVNELAPRPHNSGHYSIEACWSSQFDNHVRAVLGLPLGDPSMRVPAAAMVNLLGRSTLALDATELSAALRETRAAIHLYGKAENRPGRKMGHVTAVGETVEEALRTAEATAARISL